MPRRVAKPNVHPRGKGAWYRTTTYMCVLCGHETRYKERVVGERNVLIETACGEHFL